eukprot:8752338-Prorocentrum_lima.AAC.1
MMRTMYEKLSEYLNEDQSSHWTRSAKNWELVSRLKKSALASLESMAEAGRKFQAMEFDFT